MKIFVLDDLDERHFGFSIHYAGHEIIKAYNVKEAIKVLETHKDFDVIQLDHSLGDYEHFPPEENKRPLEHTGMEVVDYLINSGYHNNTTAIIVHSWDIEPARMMAYRLHHAGFKNVKREPYKAPPNLK